MDIIGGPLLNYGLQSAGISSEEDKKGQYMDKEH
jgi:hypothetical protein